MATTRLYLWGFPTTTAMDDNYWIIWNTLKARYPTADKTTITAPLGCAILRYSDEKAVKSATGAINETWTFRLGKKKYQIYQVGKLTAIGTVRVMGQPDLNELKASLNIPEWPWALIARNEDGTTHIHFNEATRQSFALLQSVKNCEINGQRYTITSKEYFPALHAVKKCASDSKISSAVMATRKALSWSKVAADLPTNLPTDLPPAEPLSLRGEQAAQKNNITEKAGDKADDKADDKAVDGVENDIQNKRKGFAKIRNEIESDSVKAAEATVEALKARVDELLQENHRKDGELRVYREFVEVLQKKAQDARDEQLKAQEKLDIMTQSLLCRSLLDDLTNALRMGHGTFSLADLFDQSQDDISRRRLLQICSCHSCNTTFEEIHKLIITEFDLVDTFSVQQMRAIIAQCFERFSKVAHPTERSPIKSDVFQEDWVKHVLWGVAKARSWRTA